MAAGTKARFGVGTIPSYRFSTLKDPHLLADEDMLEGCGAWAAKYSVPV